MTDLSATKTKKGSPIPEPNKEKLTTIVIKKQTINLTIMRSDLIEVKETGDGVVFNLQGNLHMTLTDPRMPLEVKRAISVAVNTFKAANIVVDLMNYVQPVTVVAD